jgi:preprotein translocase subunit Sec63
MLRNRVVQLDRELRLETVKARALTDEVARPMNVHRWRVLESSDPQRFDKIRQIQDMQKLLMQKSDELVQTDLLVQEREKVYVELKNIIARQPGPETEDQLLSYQQTSKSKFKQLHSLRDELDMYREQVANFKDDIVQCDDKMTNLKKRWFKMKRSSENNQ